MKKIAVLLFTLMTLCFLNGCGGGGHQVANTPNVNIDQPPWPVVTMATTNSTWGGIIALRFGNAGNNSGSIYMISPTETKLVDPLAYWYGSIKWSPSGNLLASRNQNGQVAYMDRTGKLITTGDKCDHQFNWLNDGSGVITGNNTGIVVIDTGGNAKQPLYTGSTCLNPAITRDGKFIYFLNRISGGCSLYRIASNTLLAFTTLDKCEKLWDFPTTSSEAVQLEALPNGRVVVGFQGTIWLFNPTTKQRVDSIFHNISYMKLSPDGTQLLIYGGGSTQIVDTSTLSVIATAPNPPSDSNYYSFDQSTWSPDGKAVALYTYRYQEKQAVYIWTIADGSLAKVYEGPYPTKTTATSTRAYGEQSVSLSWAP